MRVQFLDLEQLHQSIRSEIDEAIDTVITSSAFVGGKSIVDFEEAFAQASRLRAVAGCNSGTDALALALRALGVGPGDEVVVPSMTFIATAEAVVHAGATPVLADVDQTDLLLTEEAVANVRTDRTRAVIPVHLYGNPVPFNRIRAWRDSGLIVVEDAAQAHLATWRDQPVGSRGHAATFSFYPGKNLGAFGDAGAVASNDSDVVDRVRRLRDHGRTTKYRHDEVGLSSRLDGLQAAVLEVKLRHLQKWTDLRRERAGWYRQELENSDVLLPWTDGAVHHLVVARVGDDRDAIREALSEVGISTGIHYPIALSQQPALEPWTRPTPVAEHAAGEILSLPIDPAFAREQVQVVTRELRRLVA